MKTIPSAASHGSLNYIFTNIFQFPKPEQIYRAADEGKARKTTDYNLCILLHLKYASTRVGYLSRLSNSSKRLQVIFQKSINNFTFCAQIIVKKKLTQAPTPCFHFFRFRVERKTTDGYIN